MPLEPLDAYKALVLALQERQRLSNEVELARGIISNVSGGNWEEQGEVWRETAKAWMERNP